MLRKILNVRNFISIGPLCYVVFVLGESKSELLKFLL